MKIDNTQKLIILMLCDVMKSMESNGSQMSLNPSFIESVIVNKYYWALNFKYPLTFCDDSDSLPKKVKIVLSILEMWRMIERSYEKLSDSDRKFIDDLNVRTKFFGFDANNEEEYGIASFIINELERFQEFRGRYLNSHSPSVEYYLKMLKIYSNIPDKTRIKKENLLDLFQKMSDY